MQSEILDKAYSRISWRLIPILFCIWVLSYIDRTNIGFAKLQMLSDLKFDDAIYGLGAGIFFIGYLIFEVPSNLLLQKIGARKTIVRITIGWGLTCMAMIFVTTSGLFYFLRFLLGSFEAGFSPAVVFYLSLWFPTDRRAKALALFFCGINVAGVIGAPLAGTLMTRFTGFAGLAGWQWIFLVEGALTVVVGLIALGVITDRLEEAHWLAPAARDAVREDLERDKRALGPRATELSAALRDGRTWLLTAIYFCAVMANAALFYWGPTILRDAGFGSPATIGWIFSAVSLIGVVGMIVNAAHSDRQRETRYHTAGPLIACAAALVVIGAAPHESTLVLVAFAVALVSITAGIVVFWQMPNFILAGTAAAVSIAIINSFGNLGSFLSPYAMGLLSQMTGQVSLVLWCVAALDVAAAVAIILFVPAARSLDPKPATA